MKITELETFVVGNPPPHFGGRYFIFLKLTTDDGIEGLGEVYGATFGPHLVAAHDRGRLRRARDRRRPVPHRAALARRLRPGLFGPAGHLAARRAQRHRDGVLGHRRQGRREAGLRASRRARPRAAARLHVPLPGAGRRDRRLPRPRPRRRARRGVRRHEASRRSSSTRPGTTRRFDPRQPGLEELDRCERYIRTVREAVGDRCDLLFGTHGQFTPSGAIRLARRLEPYDPLWFEEPTPPELPRGDGAGSARDVDPGRDRRAADDEVRVRPRARDRCSVDPAAEPRPRRRPAGGEEDRGAGRGALRPDRAPSLLRPGRRRGQHPAQRLQPELPHPRGDPRLGRLPRRDPEDADPVGGRLRDPADDTGSRRRAGRGGRGPPPIRGRRVASDAACSGRQENP